MQDSALTLSKLIFAGTSIVLLMYGVYFTLTAICMHYVLSNFKRTRNWPILIYMIASLIVTTMFLGASGKYTEIILLELPFNPPTAETERLFRRLDLMQQVTVSVKIWLADSLLIYRLWIVWLGWHQIVVLPLILFLGSLCSGIAGVSLFWDSSKAKEIRALGVGFHACSVALNVITTLLIAGRLMYQRKQIRDLGEEHSKRYLSLMAVFAESGAIYSISGLVFIPLYARNSVFVYPFAGVVEAASGIAPALILLRMALGVAVSRKTQKEITTLAFNHTPSQQASEWEGSYTARGTESGVSEQKMTTFEEEVPHHGEKNV
ncbi:hypothetical protein CPC08DRAFT_708871 [Agrocybe pediades]|nr:hypothetical protein CPC08DRAFT_708871 [Agrocybe pediades]